MSVAVLIAGLMTGLLLGVFGVFGVFGTYAGALLGVVTPIVIQLAAFALVMYTAAWKMLRPGKQNSTECDEADEDCIEANCKGNYSHVALHGIGVGVLTGVVGVGGGFLIVPALVLLSRLPMKHAVGTSLSIVALKSFAGFAG